MRGSALFVLANTVGGLITTSALAGGGTCAPINQGGNNSTNGAAPTICCVPGGPDVIVGIIPNFANYTPDGSDGNYDAFSFATTSCNVGDDWLRWLDDGPSNLHPVIAQNMYRYKNNRFEHIGVSWLKHGFFALSNADCCNFCNGTNGDWLGIGCSDPYSATRNGSQTSFIGPRWQVNAHTGVFPYPPSLPAFSGQTGRRLRVNRSDLEPSSPTVRFFAECIYVTQDDAQSGNGNNNASYRQVNMSGTAANYSVSGFVGLTMREQAGIRAWKDQDPTVTEVDMQVPGEGLFILAAKVTDNGNGTWHYEYAVENLNSDRSGGSFSVPVPAGAQVTNVGFHDVEYHSNDGLSNTTFDGTNWAGNVAGGAITWQTAQTFAQNANANAIRWASLYNFRFDANVAPVNTGVATIGLFKPGTPASVASGAVVPVPGPLPICNGNTNGDGVIDVNDLLAVIGNWGAVGANPADVNGDLVVNVNDLLMVVGNWGKCP